MGAPADPARDTAREARRLLRAQAAGALGTLTAEGAPYASLVMIAADLDASPILLISGLAEHTKNILRDDRVSLLVDGTAGLDERLTGARITVQGRIARTADETCRRRYLARHPSAAGYAGFADFAFFRLAVERAHLVAGFGRIHWVERAALLWGGETAALAASETEIVAHMNADHADAVQLYATRLLGRSGDGWTLTGCDPEGCDLARGGETARLDFDKPVSDAEGARVELVRLVKRARAAGPD
jgi:putative heme iron utilization protein